MILLKKIRPECFMLNKKISFHSFDKFNTFFDHFMFIFVVFTMKKLKFDPKKNEDLSSEKNRKNELLNRIET